MIGISSSIQFIAWKRNDVFMAEPVEGDTEKDPGRGAPFVTTVMDERDVMPLSDLQLSENTNVDLCPRLPGAMTKFTGVNTLP